MIEVSVLTSAFGFALGIADADRIGASAKVHAANPINKSRFMRFAPWIALSRRLIMHRHPDCSMDGTSIVQDRYAHRNGPSADCAPRPLVSELRLRGSALGEKAGQPRFLHSGMRLAAFSRDLCWPSAGASAL